jgi:hypothetical protein
VLTLPNEVHRQKCDQKRPEVEDALAAQFGRPVRLRLVVDREAGNGASEPRGPEPDEGDELDSHDVAALEDAPADDRSAADRLMQAFGGGDLAEEDPP